MDKRQWPHTEYPIHRTREDDEYFMNSMEQIFQELDRRVIQDVYDNSWIFNDIEGEIDKPDQQIEE